MRHWCVDNNINNLTGNNFDVRIFNKGRGVLKLSGADRQLVIAAVEAIADGDVTKVTARDRQTGKQTVFTK